MSPSNISPNQQNPVPTGRYQSKLFNFFNRQGQQLREQSGILWRKLKIATVWGGQIALYPIYALFQASRIASKQLRTTFQKAIYRLLPAKEVPADWAIVRMLDALMPGTAQSQLRLRARAPQLAAIDTALITTEEIRAIASNLATRKILLVTADHTTIDWLTDEQQQQIENRITWELAAYWQLWRQWQAHQAVMQLGPDDASTAMTLAIDDRRTIAAPIRIFYQLMGWVSRGQLAYQLNLFDETHLVAQPQTDWFRPHFGNLPIDATWHQGQLPPIDWVAWSATLPSSSPLNRLIKAAIAHFFGNTTRRFNPVELGDIADPWDSPIEAEFVAVHVQLATAPVATPAIEAAAARPVLPTPPIRPALPTVEQGRSQRENLGQKIGGLARRFVDRLSRRDSAAAFPRLASETVSRPVNLTWSNVFSQGLTQTLIDTTATSAGYVKHPLEQVLGWLDQAMLWLETHLAKFWQWTQTTSQSLLQPLQEWWRQF